jgi:hypothetical protein
VVAVTPRIEFIEYPGLTLNSTVTHLIISSTLVSINARVSIDLLDLQRITKGCLSTIGNTPSRAKLPQLKRLLAAI